MKNSVLDYIRYKQLTWYGNMQRMNEEWLLLKILEWCPPRRRKGRPQNSWMQEATGMREKGINTMERMNRDECRRKIKLQAQKDAQTILY